MDSTWEIKALAGIKKNKHLFDEENKIAEAEALAKEAVRLAEDAELAAARLNEVKKTLSSFLEKLDKVEQTVQKELSSRSLRIDEPTTVVEKEPVVLAVEASLTRLAAARTTRVTVGARPVRVAAPRPERLAAAQSVSVLSTKQMKGVKQTTTVQKEVKQHTHFFIEPTVKKEPFVAVVVKASVIEKPAKDEPVKDVSAKDETVSEELTTTKKEDPIEEESTQEEKATIEKSIEESINKDPSEEQECSKKEIATIVTPVTESVTEDPSEDNNVESEDEKKDEDVQDEYNPLFVKEFTKVVIATVKTLVEAASIKKEEDPSDDDESTEGEIAIETVIETGGVVTVLETKTTTDSSVDNNRQTDVRATQHQGIVACGKTETDSVVDNNSTPGVVRLVIDTGKQKDVCGNNTHNTDKDTGIVACGPTKTGSSSSVDHNNNNSAPQGVVRVIETGRQQNVRSTTTTTAATTGHSSTWFGTITAHSPRSPQSHLRRIFKF